MPLHNADPVDTLGTRPGEMFDDARIARLVRADCARRPFALVLQRGATAIVKMFATETDRAEALPILIASAASDWEPMPSIEAMRRSSSFIRGCLSR